MEQTPGEGRFERLNILAGFGTRKSVRSYVMEDSINRSENTNVISPFLYCLSSSNFENSVKNERSRGEMVVVKNAVAVKEVVVVKALT